MENNKFFRLKEYDIYDIDAKVAEYQKILDEVTTISLQYYNGILKDFGVKKFKPLKIGLMRDLPGTVDITCGVALDCVRHNSVFFNLAALYLDFNNMLMDTIPHEIGHAALYEMYPNVKIGHGTIWIELMDYLKIPAIEFVQYSSTTYINIKEMELIL